jgi:hypothetical protein
MSEELSKLEIHFELVGMGMAGVPIPNVVLSPVPFEKGQMIQHFYSEQHRMLEVYSTKWVIDDLRGRFYQLVSLGARLPKGGLDDVPD